MASLRKLTPKAASTAIITAQMDVRLSKSATTATVIKSKKPLAARP